MNELRRSSSTTPYVSATIRNGASLRFVIGIALLFLLPTAAFGASFCVKDSAALAAAFHAAGGNGEDDFIKMAPGAYTPTSSGAFAIALTDDHAVVLGGGFSTAIGGTPCGLQLRGAQATVLDGAGADELLSIAVSGAGVAPVTLFNFTVRNGVSSDASSILGVFGNQGWAGDINFAGISVRGNSAHYKVVRLKTGGAITVRNSEFVENSSLDSVVDLIANGGQSAVTGIAFNNNTLASNTAPASAVFDAGTASDVRVTNSIIQGNSQEDLSVSGAHIFLDHSDIGSREIVAGVETETNAHNGAPGFVAASDYSLGATSVLRDAGDNMAFGGIGEFDVLGNPRLMYGVVDIGAHEYSDIDVIFRDGFEAP